MFAGVMPPRYDIPKAAPPPLRLVQQFVNTIDREHGREWLATPDELAEWLRSHGIDPPASLTEADRTRALGLREALRGLLLANNGRELDAEALATVNRFAEAAQLTLRAVAPDEVELAVGKGGSAGALGRIVGLVFLSMLDGTWQRLKACPNCRWAFYDYSKNRSANWCSMTLCGNRLKTRAYRKRQARRT